METKVAQQIEKKKRYVVTVSFYMDAEDDKQVIAEANKYTMNLNHQKDCRASVDGIVESQFGKIGHRKVY